MRDFLYLNEDFLKSFVAQTGRLVEEIRREKSESKKNEKGKAKFSFSSLLGGNAGINKIAKVEAEVGLNIENTPSKFSDENISKSIYIQKRNDEIFNAFEAYINEKKLYQTKDAIKVGGYLKATYDLNFINFTRIDRLFNKELWKTYIAHSDESHFPQDNLNSIRDNLSFLRTVIPHDTFLCGENIVIPIDNELFLRGNVHQIGFSFEKKATVVGRVKKLIDFSPQNQEALIKTLNEIQNITFKLMDKLGFVKISPSNKLFVIYPIAIFF